MVMVKVTVGPGGALAHMLDMPGPVPEQSCDGYLCYYGHLYTKTCAYYG